MNKLPTPAQLVSPIEIAIRGLGGSAHFREIEKAVAENLNLNKDDISKIRSGGRTEFAYRLSWARAKAKSEGRIVNEGKGIWAINVEKQ